MNKEETRVFTRRVLIAVGIIAAVVLILLLSWKAINVLLLLFAGVLLAVFLNGGQSVKIEPHPYCLRK